MKRYVRASALVLALLLLQTTFVPIITVEGATPDLLLIWVVFVSLRRGQIEGTISGFLVGLAEDLTTTQFLGLAALSKTVAGFVMGYFFNANKMPQLLGTYRFPLLVMLSAGIHGVIYFPIFLLGSDAFAFQTLVVNVVATALYTSIVSVLPMFGLSRRQFL